MNVFLSLMFKNIFCDIKALALLCILNKCSSLLLTSLPSDSVSSPFPKSDLFFSLIHMQLHMNVMINLVILQ